MLKFSMEKHRVTVDPVSLILEPLREIWMADKSKFKDEAIKLLSYIHICAQIDANAPFYKADPGEVYMLVKREIFGDYNYEFTGKFDEEYMENAVVNYQLAFETPEQASIRVYDKKIFEINRLIGDTKIEISKVAVRGGTDYVSNFTILNKMMQDMTKINQARETLRNTIIGQATQNTVRGQRQVSLLEKRRAESDKLRLKKKEREEEMDPPEEKDETF